MTEHPAPDDVAADEQARFEVVAGTGQEPAMVRAIGDIDLTNASRYHTALSEAGTTPRSARPPPAPVHSPPT